MKLEFTCPDCGCHQLKEVMVNATVETDVVLNLDENGEHRITYGLSRTTDGDIHHYKCLACGYILMINVNNVEGLARWFEGDN